MDILSNAEQRMSKAISNFQDAIAVLRTGRANAALLENIECDYYGDRMNITSIAAIKVPEPRQLLIVPYDQGDIKTIVAAINEAIDQITEANNKIDEEITGRSGGLF